VSGQVIAGEATTGAVRTGKVTSPDGTRIAYSVIGQGPALVLVDGALCNRWFGPMPTLAPRLLDRQACAL
jgi:hypothetical protein